MRVECRFRASVVKSFESPVGQRGTRPMIMGHGGGGGAPVRMEQQSERPKGDSKSTHGTPSLNLPLDVAPVNILAHYRPIAARHRKNTG